MSAEPSDRPLVVLGGGVMGSSIATLAIGHGLPVRLIDSDAEALDQARSRIGQQLRHAQLLDAWPAGQRRGKLTTATSTTGIGDAVAVIEAIVEIPEQKAKAFAELGEVFSPGTPLITNTSAIPISEVASWVRHPDRVVGVHFMNPPYLIETVEVICGSSTSPVAVHAVTELLASLGRKPVTVSDTPGFVTSRLLHPMINDAARIVGEGVAVEAVDALMQGGLGHPVGPLRTADLIGIDNLVDALNVLYRRTGISYYEPCAVLLEKVRAGELGQKTGKGFYDYGKV